MKRILFIIFLFLTSIFVYAGQMPIGEIKVQEYLDSSRQMVDKKSTLKYDVRSKTTYMYFEDVMGDYAIVLNEKIKNEFFALCKKFLEIAAGQTDNDRKKQARLGVITTSLYFSNAGRWYMSKPDVPVFVSFLPQAESVYDMALSFGRAVSMKNKTILRSPSDRYITEEETKRLVEMLSAENGQKK